jgi:hypothetical protein
MARAASARKRYRGSTPLKEALARVPAGKGATLEKVGEAHGFDTGRVNWRAVDAVRSTRETPAMEAWLKERHDEGDLREPSGRPGAAAGRDVGRGGQSPAAVERAFRATRADKASVDAKIQEALDIYGSEGVQGLERRANVSGRIDDPATRTSSPRTRVADLAVLCPTCHRSLHCVEPPVTVSEMRSRVTSSAGLGFAT